MAPRPRYRAVVETHTVVLVEGVSDRVALEALARRRGRDLGAEGVAVVPIGGATKFRRSLDLYGPAARVAGLCDAAEEVQYRRGLEYAGRGWEGFFVCVADLEDELIRALGPATVEDVVAAQGELGSFRTLQQQPAQRGRSVDAQLRRFMGTRGGRKIRYARLLVDALDVARVPPPLERLLAYV